MGTETPKMASIKSLEVQILGAQKLALLFEEWKNQYLR